MLVVNAAGTRELLIGHVADARRELQATPGQMAVLGIAEYISSIIVGFVADVWIDRQRRRPLLIGTHPERSA